MSACTKGAQRDTEKWPRDRRDELDEKCDLLRERESAAPNFAYPWVDTSGEGAADSESSHELRLHGALGGRYGIVFARDDRGNYLLLAGGKEGRVQ